MKIAVLGWGSLIWDPRELALDSQWRSDGPMLPLEFARKSGGVNANRLTLVVFERGSPVQTLWAISKYTDLKPAIENLATREKTTVARIAHLTMDPENPAAPLADRSRLTAIAATATKQRLLSQIDSWGIAQGLDAVVWTDLESNFQDVTPEAAVRWLRNVVATDKTGAAEQYVRHAPAQVRTAVRDRIEHELGWLPTRTPAITP